VTPEKTAPDTKRRRPKRPLDPILQDAIATWMDIDGDLTWFEALKRAKAEAPRLRERADAKRAERARVEAEIAAWTHPVGTLVWVRLDDGHEEATATRSAPWLLCEHASILLEGISGGYSLERVRLREASP